MPFGHVQTRAAMLLLDVRNDGVRWEEHTRQALTEQRGLLHNQWPFSKLLGGVCQQDAQRQFEPVPWMYNAINFVQRISQKLLQTCAPL